MFSPEYLTMNPIDSMENADLLQFFHRHKTDLACMEKPRIFLTQLRDHNLVSEDMYQVKNHRLLSCRFVTRHKQLASRLCFCEPCLHYLLE